jgi:hypothetical protein
MVHALAAMCAPLTTTDVVEAADKLTADSHVALVIDRLLRRGADLLTARRVVEALRALRDARVTESDLAGLLLAHEAGLEVDPPALAEAAERICQKLGRELSRLTSTSGSQAILSRALHVASAQFPFLEGVRAGVAPDTCLQGLSECMSTINIVEGRDGLQAVLSVLLDLLVGFIGEGLTTRLVQDVWPELPAPKPARPDDSDGQMSNC